MKILVANPGGNSLKVEIVSCEPRQRYAFEATKIVSVGVEDIGKDPKLLQYRGKEVVKSDPIEASNYAEAIEGLFNWFEKQGPEQVRDLRVIERVGVRVVHGGPDLNGPTKITQEVEKQIRALEKLAPLHNKSSLEILNPIRQNLGKTPIYAVFDTAFHQTIPQHASTYAIPLELSEKHHIRRYGFHGISHRYLLERYAHLAGKPVDECNVVTMHLESGCSVTAIRNGKSIDNTMGLTPLEGLMMGTRSGDVDPSLIPLLVKEEKMTIEDVMTMLNKESGLFGVSGVSLDTRILMKQYESNDRVKLAMNMFAYRLLKAVAASLAAVGGAEAIVFGGGIAENGKFVRAYLAKGLRWCGFELDPDANERTIDIEGKITKSSSRIQGWVIPAEEAMEIAHECLHASTS